MSKLQHRSSSANRSALQKKVDGKTNAAKNSLVKAVVLEDAGKWIKPAKGEKFFIAAAASEFPEIVFKIDCEVSDSCVWEWSIHWVAKVSGLREVLPRGALVKKFSLSGKAATDAPEWKVDLNGEMVGGVLTVQTVVAGENFKRSVYICGKNPEKEQMLSYLSSFSDARGYEKIIEQETRGKHFLDIDGEPIVAFDKGYGISQLTNPSPSYRQVWSWRENIKAGVNLYTTCRQRAKKMLDAHPPYTDEMLLNETYARWNGGGYYVWDAKGNKWMRRVEILCDSKTGNIGWDKGHEGNAEKKEHELHERDKDTYRLGKKGQDDQHRWQYSGICYADHLRGADE